MGFLLNDAENHENSFSFGWRRDHSQASFTTATFSQARSQEFAVEGAVSEVWNQTEIVYIWNWNGFLPEIRWRPQKNEKKGLLPCWDRVLRPNSTQVQSQSSHILIANDNEWAIFAFRAKFGLKSNIKRVFCILC